jgi:hypothetical protein
MKKKIEYEDMNYKQLREQIKQDINFDHLGAWFFFMLGLLLMFYSNLMAAVSFIVFLMLYNSWLITRRSLRILEVKK